MYLIKGICILVQYKQHLITSIFFIVKNSVQIYENVSSFYGLHAITFEAKFANMNFQIYLESLIPKNSKDLSKSTQSKTKRLWIDSTKKVSQQNLIAKNKI